MLAQLVRSGLLIALTTLSAGAAEPSDCTENANLGDKFSTCTTLIEAGTFQGTELAELLTARATAYRAIGDAAGAIGDLDRALTLDDGRAEAFAMRGAAYQDLGQLDRAIADYNKALELAPDDVAVISNRASAKCASGEAEAAVADWQRTIGDGFWPAKDAQAWLKEQGFYNGTIDGQFGPQSRRALGAWVAAGCP